MVVHYPGVELITEADLSAGSDPYLSDHLLDGDLLFPAVHRHGGDDPGRGGGAGPATGTPLLEDVEFLRPIMVSAGGSTTIRLAALVQRRRARWTW